MSHLLLQFRSFSFGRLGSIGNIFTEATVEILDLLVERGLEEREST